MFGKRETVSAERIDTVMAPETHFWGKIVSRGTLRIDGQVEGEISTQGDVIVGESGRVVAQIQCRNIFIAGEVKGNVVYVGRVEIATTASLEGEVQMEPMAGHATSSVMS